MFRTATALLALLAFSTALAAKPLSPEEIALVDRIVAGEMARNQTPSVSIAIVRDGEIAFTKAYGKASDQLTATPDLPYQIASNSKQFTAMALLLLEDEGKLSLDDKVSKYLPQVSGSDTMTLRQLLDHTSGMRDFWPQDYAFPAMATPVKPADIVARWASAALDYEPGTKTQYTNTAYVAAGLVVEKVAGEPLMQFLASRIFRPLGMASVISQDVAVGPAFPVGFGRAALGPVRAEPPAARGWLYAAGELSMTASDLARWNIARMSRALVPADDWTTQETATLLKDGTDTKYGLGVGIDQFEGHRRVAHGGESVGFLSTNQVFPDDKAAVTVLTNSWSGDAQSAIARSIARILLTKSAAAASPGEAKVAALYDLLRSGRIDRALLTANANHYFTSQRVADFGSSLAPLGAPLSVAPSGSPYLRGGFVIQPYEVRFADQALRLSVFLEPGPDGRIEQFLVTPGR